MWRRMPLRSTFLRLGLPDSINSLVGRLVGYVELQKGPAFRNDVLRSKKVLIGCGGGFHQECSQPYRPVAKWIEDADIAKAIRVLLVELLSDACRLSPECVATLQTICREVGCDFNKGYAPRSSVRLWCYCGLLYIEKDSPC